MEIKTPRSKRYEKAELPGEDTRHELDVTERRKAELPGEDARHELNSAESRRAELAGEQTIMEMEAIIAAGNRGVIHELSV